MRAPTRRKGAGRARPDRRRACRRARRDPARAPGCMCVPAHHRPRDGRGGCLRGPRPRASGVAARAAGTPLRGVAPRRPAGRAGLALPHREGWLSASGRLRMVFEITERALALDPTALLWNVGWARDLGFGIALDKVGVRRPRAGAARLLAPGRREARPRPPPRQVSRSSGGDRPRRGGRGRPHWGQGCGRGHRERCSSGDRAGGRCDARPGLAPRPSPSAAHATASPRAPVGTGEPASSVPVGFTPFDMLQERRPVQRTTKAVLCAMSRSLEHEALVLREPPS
jgi:hypothetical protein